MVVKILARLWLGGVVVGVLLFAARSMYLFAVRDPGEAALFALAVVIAILTMAALANA